VLLDDAVGRPRTPLDELAMVPADEVAPLVGAVNDGADAYPGLRPIHAAFEEAARARPTAVAVEAAGGATVTYGELDRRATALAHVLRATGTGPGDLVGVCAERSIEMVVAVLAVVKARAAYVPLDPRSPVERLRVIARDAGIGVVVAQDELLGRLSPLPVRLVVERPSAAPPAASAAPLPAVSLDDVACVYYTSGSTGAPKGVVLDHRGVAGRLEWLVRRYGLGEGDRLVHKTPLIFDVAVWEIFGPLGTGATVLLADPGAEGDADHIAGLLGRDRTRFVHFVPSMLSAYLDTVPPRPYPDLAWVQLSGEGVPAHLLERFGDHFPTELHNLYGQTETSEVAGWEGRTSPSATDVPIGTQIGLYRLFLLDAAQRPVPPGVPAELHVAGVGGLAHGYRGRPRLTAERFVPNPYPVEPGERLYRTGDLAWADESGVLYHWGRVDGQTKIRGCRVEPGEVEAVLRRHPAVRDCAVDARTAPGGDGGEARLVAYVVGAAAGDGEPAGGGPSAHQLARHVEQHLPAYLRPEVYVELDALPLTASGKLDRRRLPEPTADDLGARSTDEEPRTALEAEVALFWQEVLGVERVGRSDDFFGTGGNSLRALQVLNRIRATFGVKVKVSVFFAEPTVAALATAIEEALADMVAGMSEEEAAGMLAELGAGGPDALG
jgi:amino acid adenylation domain-containing protein